MAISKGYKSNFETLKRAHNDGRLALMECQDKKTKKKVYVICAVSSDPEGGEAVDMVPLAKLFDGNPYGELNPPDPGKKDGFIDMSKLEEGKPRWPKKKSRSSRTRTGRPASK